jgi:hypothetical protein
MRALRRIQRNTEATARAAIIQTQMMYDAMTPEQQRQVDAAEAARATAEAEAAAARRRQQAKEADTMILRGSLFLGALVAMALVMGGIGAILH